MAIQRGDRRRRLPHGEMKYVFRICHATIPHFQIVKIVPCTWLSFADNRSVFVDDIHHRAVKAGKRTVVGGAWASVIWAIERVVDVAAHPPAV